MKPLHIAMLVAAGALGGAVIMKISQRPPAAQMARTQTPPATQRAMPPATAPAVSTAPPPGVITDSAPPSPFVASNPLPKAPKPVPAHRAAAKRADTRALAVRQPVRQPSASQ